MGTSLCELYLGVPNPRLFPCAAALPEPGGAPDLADVMLHSSIGQICNSYVSITGVPLIDSAHRERNIFARQIDTCVFTM